MADKLEQALRHLRESHPDAVAMFTEGGCFGLAQMIRALDDRAVIMHDQLDGHVLCLIAGCLYDINGKIFIDDYPNYAYLEVLDEEKAKVWTPNWRAG